LTLFLESGTPAGTWGSVGNGKLEFVRKYDIEATDKKQQFWAGMVSLAWRRRVGASGHARKRGKLTADPLIAVRRSTNA
jgi:hypothetical protein